jgi:CBS-domain-containing membrane protein
MNEMTVSMVMTRHPAAVAPHTPFKEILELMAERRICALPVVSATGLVIGVVSEVDLLRDRTHGSRSGSGRLTANELMTRPVLTVSPRTPLADASRMLSDSGLRQLFVVDDGRLVGVLSVRDALSVYRRSDKEILAEIERELLEPVPMVRIDVDHGVVQLTGRVPRQADLETTVARISAVPGVVDIKERTR